MKKTIGMIAVSAILATSSLALDLPSNQIVDAAWLKANAGNKDLVIVDIRKKGCKEEHIEGAVCWTPDKYRESRYYTPVKATKNKIPGYIAAPLTIKNLMRRSGVNNDSAVVFYSGGTKAKDFRDSALGIVTLMFHGFDNVALLDGGLAGWKKTGGAVSSKKTKVKKGDFSFKGRKFNQDIIATGEDVDEAVWTCNYQLVDGNGVGHALHWNDNAPDKVDPRRKAEGHLPNSKGMHTKVLAVKKDGVYYLGDKAHAQAEFKKENVSTTKPILWYCNTGHLICGNWFVARNILGMKDADNRVYNASMADYTRWPKRPLIKGDKAKKMYPVCK